MQSQSIGVASLNSRSATRLGQPAPGRLADMTLDVAAAASRLSESVRFRTVTTDDEAISAPEAFTAFHAFLERSFPLVAKNLPREVVGNYSLLYTWTGAHPDRAPVILLAHQDVVPADPASLQAWRHPPFDGVIADGAIWGRGTLDDKSGVMGTLEAVEELLARGFVPPGRGVRESEGARCGQGALRHRDQDRPDAAD